MNKRTFIKNLAAFLGLSPVIPYGINQAHIKFKETPTRIKGPTYTIPTLLAQEYIYKEEYIKITAKSLDMPVYPSNDCEYYKNGELIIFTSHQPTYKGHPWAYAPAVERVNLKVGDVFTIVDKSDPFITISKIRYIISADGK